MNDALSRHLSNDRYHQSNFRGKLLPPISNRRTTWKIITHQGSTKWKLPNWLMMRKERVPGCSTWSPDGRGSKNGLQEGGNWSLQALWHQEWLPSTKRRRPFSYSRLWWSNTKSPECLPRAIRQMYYWPRIENFISTGTTSDIFCSISHSNLTYTALLKIYISRSFYFYAL